ncbi:MAG: amidohydrolase family protein [Planctomycetes bacterium]|nr:amidohydrolase family protein [Planctomycetota bacterium]
MANAKALKFFDCNCAFGPYRTRVFRFARTADELLGEMDFSNIEQALVYHTAMRFDHPVVGNERVVRESRGHSRLFPTWALLPSQTEEQPPLETLLREMRRQGVRALRLFPDDHRYFLDEITWGDQMAVFMERRIPLFIRASLDRIATLLRSFPDLVVVTGSQGSNPLDRYAWPLIERYPNLIFETSSYLVDGGIEEFCKRYSATRLIFGSGFPDNAGGAAMLTLARAEISDTDRRAIAWDNLCRLLEEASLP